MASREPPDSPLVADDSDRLLALIESGLDSPVSIGDDSTTEQLMGLCDADDQLVAGSAPSVVQPASLSEDVPSGTTTSLSKAVLLGAEAGSGSGTDDNSALSTSSEDEDISSTVALQEDVVLLHDPDDDGLDLNNVGTSEDVHMTSPRREVTPERDLSPVRETSSSKVVQASLVRVEAIAALNAPTEEPVNAGANPAIPLGSNMDVRTRDSQEEARKAPEGTDKEGSGHESITLDIRYAAGRKNLRKLERERASAPTPSTPSGRPTSKGSAKKSRKRKRSES